MESNLIHDIKARFDNCTITDLNNYLDNIKNKWVLQDNCDLTEYIKRFCENLNINHQRYEYEEFYESWKMK